MVKPYQTVPNQDVPNRLRTLSFEAVASDAHLPKPSLGKEPSPEGIELARLLRERILENNPNAKTTDFQERKWAHEVDRMIARDNRTLTGIRELIEFCQADSFWRSNILSMGKLCEKFDQLTMKKETPIAKGKLTGEALTRHNLRVAGFLTK